MKHVLADSALGLRREGCVGSYPGTASPASERLVQRTTGRATVVVQCAREDDGSELREVRMDTVDRVRPTVTSTLSSGTAVAMVPDAHRLSVKPQDECRVAPIAAGVLRGAEEMHRPLTIGWTSARNQPTFRMLSRVADRTGGRGLRRLSARRWPAILRTSSVPDALRGRGAAPRRPCPGRRRRARWGRARAVLHGR